MTHTPDLTSALVRVLKLTSLAGVAAVGLWFLVFLFLPPRLLPQTRADFMQDYLMSRAVLAGESPYQNIKELAGRFDLAQVQLDRSGYPSPHPPSLVLLMLPIGLLSYHSAALAWLIISLAALAASLRVLFDLKGGALVLGFLAAVIWLPFHSDFSIGQLMTVMLLALALAWKCFRGDRDLAGGIVLGLALSIKMIAWPVVLYLLLKRRWQAAGSSIGVVAGLQLIAGAVFGFSVLADYYLRVGPLLAKLGKADSFNFSVFSIGPRIFEGTRAVFLGTVSTSPAVYGWPQLSGPVSALCALLVLALCLWLALRSSSFDRSFAVLVCGVLILSPTAWWYYFPLALIPMSIAWQLQVRPAVLVCLVAPYSAMLLQPLFGSSASFAAGLLTIAPAAALVLLALRVHGRPLARLDNNRMVDPHLAHT